MSTATETPTTTSTEESAPLEKSRGDRFTGWAANYIDERTALSGLVRELGRKIFPDHWSFMLGEVALYSFIVILLSGTFLTFFFQASMVPVEYEGSYLGLKGVEMSAAMASTLDISFDIRGGLLMRQVHHWAALLFVASIGLHMLRDLLHRRVPQAARAELGHRLRALRPRDGRGLHRLLAAR